MGRPKWEIMKDILTIAKTCRKPYELRKNMNGIQFSGYINEAIGAGILEEKDGKKVVTDKGSNFLKKYDSLKKAHSDLFSEIL